jgi:hypothetical protein
MCRLCREFGTSTICRPILRYTYLTSLHTRAYTYHMAENEIVGEALVALQHEDLKEMGIPSVGHRLTILKSVYEIKIKQDIPIESDHYIPLCKCRIDLSH